MPGCRTVVILARRAHSAAPSCAVDIPRLRALLRFSRCPLSAQNWSARLPGEQGYWVSEHGRISSRLPRPNGQSKNSRQSRWTDG